MLIGTHTKILVIGLWKGDHIEEDSIVYRDLSVSLQTIDNRKETMSHAAKWETSLGLPNSIVYSYTLELPSEWNYCSGMSMIWKLRQPTNNRDSRRYVEPLPASFCALL